MWQVTQKVNWSESQQSAAPELDIGVEFILQRLPTLDAGDRQRQLAGIASELSNTSGRGSGCLRGELVSFQQGDLRPLLGQLPGDRRAHDAAADDDDFRAPHAPSPFCVLNSCIAFYAGVA